MNTLLKNKNILTIIISCFIVLILFASSSFFHVLNKSIQNRYYSIKNEIIGLQANPHIVVVEIDEASFKEIGKFPFSRGVYATILENIKKYDVGVVALDILFLDPSDPEGDKDLAKAISQTSNVVLGSAMTNSREILSPFSGLDSTGYEQGFLSPNIDSSNRTVYSFSPLIVAADALAYEHFAVKVFRSFHNYLYSNDDLLGNGEYSSSHYKLSENISFPLAQEDSNEILINFIPKEEFTRVSLRDLYITDRLRQVEREIGLKDAILLIGPAAEGLKDEFATPNGIEYGVYVHANILNTFLSGKFMMYFHKQLEWLMIFFLIILSVSVNLSSSNKVLIFSNGAIVLIFWFIIPLSVLLGTNLILNYPSEIIFSLLLAFSSANIVKYLIEDTNKQKLNKALSEYVSSNIAEEILKGEGQVNLDGEQRELVCFFSDIEGFTSLSERLSPQELVRFLREYLSAMTSIIMDQQGHVDKFEGDAIMAMWGAFTGHSKSDFIHACDGALQQQKALNKINLNWSKKLGAPIRARMGLHGGKAIVGNIGALGKKMEFTALGDNVNLASRLEGVNKYYGTYICVSEVVHDAVKDFYAFRYLDEIQVKGKDVPVKIYELIGKTGELSPEKKQFYDAFGGAIKLYRAQRFTEAKDIFEWLSSGGDAPTKFYIERCDYYIENPPEEDWNGVWRMMEK